MLDSSDNPRQRRSPGASTNALGERVGPYEIRGWIARGGMGEVFLARDTLLGRTVALKIIASERVDRPDAKARFLKEARATAAMSHPNIVTVYAVGEHAGRPYLALEYVNGETLRARLRKGVLGTAEALRVALAIASALAAAHEQGIVHRDLKPENVMLARNGSVRVLDFGLARSGSERGGPHRRAGTPAYMSPEAWTGDAEPASDIWALGIVTCEMLFGERPFAASETPVERLATLVHAPDPVPLPSSRPDLGGEARALLEAMLAKATGQRPAASALVRELRALLGRGEPKERRAEPFPGLLSFGEEDAEVFFGRDAEIASFVERMRRRVVLSLVGPSGAGKTSFVQAGVIPRLREQGPWHVLRVAPGRHPFGALAAQLASGEGTLSEPGSEAALEPLTPVAPEGDPHPSLYTADASGFERGLAREIYGQPARLEVHLELLARATRCRVLLFIDQLEELGTLVEDGEVRRRFMEAICSPGLANEDVRVVLALRDDFFGRLAEGARAREALGQVAVIRAPATPALRDALIRPLEGTGFRWESAALVDRLVSEVRGAAASLPLLQHAARLLWERRDRESFRLTAKAYEELGGVVGALKDHADAELEHWTDQELGVAKAIFLRLVTSERTRRVASRAEVLEGLPEFSGALLDRLISARLITVRRPGETPDDASTELEIVHESLLVSWPRLARWFRQSQDGIRVAEELTQAARVWKRRGSGEGLYGRAALEELDRVLGDATLPPGTEPFVRASRDAAQRGERRRRGALMTLAALIALAVLGSTAAAIYLAGQEQRARELLEDAIDGRAAAEREGALRAILRGDLVEGRARLRASAELRDSSVLRASWWQLRNRRLLWERRFGSTVYDARASPDGQTVAVATQDGSVHLIDVQTLDDRALRGHTDQVLSLAWAPDGQTLVSGGWGGELRAWDPATGGTRWTHSVGSMVVNVAISADGRWAAIASGDGTVEALALSDPTQRRVLERLDGTTWALAFAPGGARLLTGGSAARPRLRSWDLDAPEGTPPTRWEDPESAVRALAFNPSGDLVAIGDFEGRTRLFDARTGRPRPVELPRQTGIVKSVAFVDDATLVTAGDEGTVYVVDAERGVELQRWASGEPASLSVLRRTARGGPSVVVGEGGARDRVSLFRLDPDLPSASAVPAHTGPVLPLALSRTGGAVSGGDDGRVIFWDLPSGRPRWARAHVSPVLGVAISVDGQETSGVGRLGFIPLWSSDDGALRRRLRSEVTGFVAVRRMAGGGVLAAGMDHRVHRFEPGSAAPLTSHRHGFDLRDVDASADGSVIVSAGDDGIHVFDAALTEQSHLVAHEGVVRSIAVASDGRTVVSGGEDGTVRVWDRQTGEGRVLADLGARVYWLDLDPSDSVVAAPLADHTVRVLPLDGSAGVTLRGHRDEAAYARFTPDGRRILTSSDDATVRLFDAHTGHPVWHAPALLDDPVELRTHRGWEVLDGAAPAAASPWRDAIAARALWADERGETGCLSTYDGALERWQTGARAHRLERVEPDGLVRAVWALPGRCVVLSERGLLELAGAPPRRLVADAVAAFVSDDGIWAAAPDRVVELDVTGRPRGTRDGSRPGLTALAPLERGLVVGFGDGGLIIERGGERRSLTAGSAGVVRLAPGPDDLLAVGHADGLLRLVSIVNGAVLHEVRLHGPVIHLRWRQGILYAGSELGESAVLDLSSMQRPYCAFLRAIWAAVPFVWEDGRVIRRAPPEDHPCAEISP